MSETFYKRWYCTYQELFIYARKSKAKSLKYFSKGILLSVKLQNKHLLLLRNYLKYFAENFCISCYTFNPNIHKLVSQDHKQYIYSAASFIQKMPESSDSMYFSIFMLENIYYNFIWSGPISQEILDFVPIKFRTLEIHNWNKIKNFFSSLFPLG